MDSVPVPVLIFVSVFTCCVLDQDDTLPIWSSLTVIEDLTNEIQVLVFFVRYSHFHIKPECNAW